MLVYQDSIWVGAQGGDRNDVYAAFKVWAWKTAAGKMEAGFTRKLISIGCCLSLAFVSRIAIITDNDNGRYLSNHYPVYAEFDLASE